MSSNEKQIQQQNLTNSIHIKDLTSPKNDDNSINQKINEITNQFKNSNQTKPYDVPYDWQKYLMERKEYLANSNPTNASNYLNQTNSVYSNAESNNTNYVRGVYAPNYRDLNNISSNVKTNNNTKFNNNSFLSDNASNNGSLNMGNPYQPQYNSANSLEEKIRENRELKEILNLINTENTTNKMLLLKLTEENTKMQIEINQIKKNQNNNDKNIHDSNLASLESKLKELEKENETIKKELNSKTAELEKANLKNEELENEIKVKSTSSKTVDTTEEAIMQTIPYLALLDKFERLEEERKNLKSYTSELQTLYGEMIEDYKASREKANGAKKLEKNLETANKELSEALTAKETFESKFKELEAAAESAKAKNINLKVEKESLVETINRLNKEIENLKEEITSNKQTKNNTNSEPNSSKKNNVNSNNLNSNNKSNISILNENKTPMNDLPELFKLELEEKEKAIQILQCSLEERDRIIDQFKYEQGKMISRNKTSHHDLINTIEDLKFKIINLENEINEKNNFISMHNNEFNIKKIETENLNLENKQLKDQINFIPSLRNELDNLKLQLKKQISQADEIKEQINEKESRIVMLEKTISALKNELEDKETQLNIATEECNTTKLYEKKRDIIHSTLLDIRDLKEKISKDKHNLTIAFNTTPNNIFTDYSRDLTDNNINTNNFNFNNETLNHTSNNNTTTNNPSFAHNFNSLLKSTDNEVILTASNNAYTNSNNAYSQYNSTKNQPIEEATPRTEGLESYRKVTEDDILFFQNVFKNFDLNLLTELDFIINSKNWKIISAWLPNLNDRKSVHSGRSNKTNSNSIKNFKLKLLFKASKDGFSHLDFKRKCCGKPNTLVIAINNYNNIIGGFTPLPWDNAEEHVYIKDESDKSFIFNVNRKEKLRLINNEHAICIGPDCGPIFGGGSDFEIVDNCNVNYNNFFRVGHSYEYDDVPENFFGAKKYLVRDYEVYEVLEC